MQYRMKSKKWHLAATLCALMLSAPALADRVPEHNNERVFHIPGVPVTGINEVCGQSVWTFDYPPPLPPDFRTPNFGKYDPRPGAIDAEPLTRQNCTPDAVVATTVDPVFATYIGVRMQDIDYRLKNLPLRNVPTPIFFDGLRGTIPLLEAVPPATSGVTQTQSKPSDPITLGKWLSARGALTIRCEADGSASASAKFRHLIANGVYTMWGAWNTIPAGSSQAAVIPVPFGGAPNAIIPDDDGSATFVRHFATCPMDPPSDGSKLLFVALVYHADAVLYGASPGPFLERLRFKASDGSIYTSLAIPGVLIQDHLIFSISGTKIVN